jgi:hypothetical protein
MLINAVLRLLPLPFPWRRAARGSERSVMLRPASSGLQEISLAPGQWALLKLARGTVLHVHEGEACIEDAPRLWADHCWSEPRRLRSGEVFVLPRTGWWRIDGRGACRISARPPAAPRSRRQPPY